MDSEDSPLRHPAPPADLVASGAFAARIAAEEKASLAERPPEAPGRTATLPLVVVACLVVLAVVLLLAMR